MLRSLETVRKAAVDPKKVVDVVVLDFDRRRRRRQVLVGEHGTEILLDLATVPNLADGDGLVLEDGRIIRVKAEPELLIEGRPRNRADLPRIAWHLGNRHLAVQFVGDAIRLRSDHVIEAMLEALGVDIRHVSAPFDPEGGAYAHGQPHNHEAHDHD